MNETTIYSFILHFMDTLKSFWFSISMQNLGFSDDSYFYLRTFYICIFWYWHSF